MAQAFATHPSAGVTAREWAECTHPPPPPAPVTFAFPSQLCGVRVHALIQNSLFHFLRTVPVTALRLTHCKLHSVQVRCAIDTHVQCHCAFVATPFQFQTDTDVHPPTTTLITALMHQSSEMGSLSKLQHLNLSHNLLRQLPHGLSQLQALTSLTVAHNCLGQPELIPGKHIGSQSTPTALTQSSGWWPPLTEPSSTVAAGTPVSDTPTRFQWLTQLDLSHNSLQSLPRELCLLPQMISLNLSHNQLSTLPSEIGALLLLQRLDVSNNQLQVCVKQYVCFFSLAHSLRPSGDGDSCLPAVGSTWATDCLFIVIAAAPTSHSHPCYCRCCRPAYPHAWISV